MPLIETESLVLKTYNLADADKIVVVLTRDHGVIRGVAKGAKRLKSKFGSGLELFSIVQLTYFQKDAVELVSIQKAELIRSYFSVASHPEFLQKFSYLSDLLVTFSPPHDPNETLFRMALSCLDAAKDYATSFASIGVYFELWILRLAGYLPDWSKCDTCGRTFSDADESRMDSNFHMICVSCGRPNDSQRLARGQRLLFDAARRLSPADFAQVVSTRQDDIKELSTTLKRIISRSVGREVTGETSLTIGT